MKRNLKSKRPKEIPPDIKAESTRLVLLICDEPLIMSLLYDLDLMPEQLEEWSEPWFDMLNIIDHMERAIKTPPAVAN